MNTPAPKQRHGCLTAYLIVVIVMNSLVTLLYLVSTFAANSQINSNYAWALPVYAILSIALVACAVALWQWKKWGFYGFVAIATLAFMMNVAMGTNIWQAALGFVSIFVLYGVLQIGGVNKGWPQLE